MTRRGAVARSVSEAVRAVERGDLDEGLNRLRRVCDEHPRDVDARLACADMQIRAERYADAVATATIAIGLDRNDARGHYARARAQAGRGKLSEALDDARIAAALSPGWNEASLMRGWLELDHHYLVEAAEAAETVIAADRGKVDGHALLAEVALEAEQWDILAISSRAVLRLRRDDKRAKELLHYAEARQQEEEAPAWRPDTATLLPEPAIEPEAVVDADALRLGSDASIVPAPVDTARAGPTATNGQHASPVAEREAESSDGGTDVTDDQIVDDQSAPEGGPQTVEPQTSDDEPAVDEQAASPDGATPPAVEPAGHSRSVDVTDDETVLWLPGETARAQPERRGAPTAVLMATGAGLGIAALLTLVAGRPLLGAVLLLLGVAVVIAAFLQRAPEADQTRERVRAQLGVPQPPPPGAAAHAQKATPRSGRTTQRPDRRPAEASESMPSAEKPVDLPRVVEKIVDDETSSTLYVPMISEHEHDDNQVEVLRAAADEAIEQEDWTTAEAHLRRLLELEPLYIPAHGRLTYVLKQQRPSRSARRQF